MSEPLQLTLAAGDFILKILRNMGAKTLCNVCPDELVDLIGDFLLHC